MNRKGFFTISYRQFGIVAFALVVLVTGLILYVHKVGSLPGTENGVANRPASSLTKVSTTTGNTPLASSSSSTIDTSHWQTYTDNAMGVAVKFPSNWYVNDANGYPGFFHLGDVNEEIPPYKPSSASFSIELRAFDNTLPIDGWYQNFFANNPLQNVVSKNQATVGGLPAIEITYSDGYRYFIAKGGHVFDVLFENGTNLATYQAILGNLNLFNPPIPQGIFSVGTANIFSQPIGTTTISGVQYQEVFNEITTPAGNNFNGEAVLTSGSVPSGREFPLSQTISNRLGEVTGAVSDPENGDLVFISTSDYRGTGNDSTNTIYAYNLNSGQLVQIYQEHAEKDSLRNPNDGRILRAEGVQGSKLILLSDDFNNSPGPCSEPWSDSKDNFLYLELADINSGLQKFIVPQDAIDAGTAYIQQCVNNGGA